jgi:nitrogenase molybdenum-iron protein NifN
VLVLPHVSLQPLELEGLKDVLSALELDVFALPDLSTSLDGHLGQDQAALCQGGIQMSEIRGLASAATVITIGESMRAVGECFTNLHPLTRHLHVPGIIGLQASDEFIGQMVELTSIEPNERIKLWRDRLRDAMIDAHFSIGKTRFILAGEPDRIADMARALVEVGGTIRAVVSSTPSKVLDGVRAEQVMVGDLEDVEAMLDECDVLICNMHGHRLAQAHGKIHVARGYPIYEQIGVQMKVDTLYQGGTQFLIDIANAIIEERLRKHH